MRLNTPSFSWFSDARRGCAHAARLLRRYPVLTFTATLSLAIGIGANTTIFTVANALLLQPPASKWDLWHAMKARGRRPKVRPLRKTA